ncbi:RluA family pseudouridine synthase [bacterium]|nr:RluA family pseudouridine synthase [bacterium]
MKSPTDDNNRLAFQADIEGERVDAFLVRMLKSESSKTLSRSKIQKLITDGYALVDGIPCKKNHILTPGEQVEITIPADKPVIIEGEQIDFDILHEDDDLIIVSKPAGVITHPTELMPSGTLVNGLIGRGIQLAPAGGKYRPGVVHRLDKETSGILAFAKTDKAYYRMVEIFKERQIEKYYRAVVIGNMRDMKGSFDLNIGRHPKNRVKMAAMKEGGKEAITDYKVLERYFGFDSLELQIHTGRTHQIRVHLAHSGRSVLNDHVYGTRKLTDHIRWLGMKGLPADRIGKLMKNVKAIVSEYQGMFLHAENLIFRHPVSYLEMNITAPLPECYSRLLEILRDLAREDME